VIAVYTYSYINGGVHLHHVARRTQITLTDRQHALLSVESKRSGLSMAELVRRAIDRTFRPHRRPTLLGFEVNFGVWKRPDAAVIGRKLDRRVVEDR
jgi:hypothetical protein